MNEELTFAIRMEREERQVKIPRNLKKCYFFPISYLVFSIQIGSGMFLEKEYKNHLEI